MEKKIIHDPQIVFNRWYRRPLTELEKIENGDGGFVVLVVSCFLYEGYVRQVLKKNSYGDNYRSRMERMSADFKTDEYTAKIFNEVIHNRILHYGTTKQKEVNGEILPGWAIYDENIPFKLSGDPKTLFVNIWKFRDRVFELYDNNPDLIGYHEDYPWGHIWYQE
jgi:hypothetical protein